MAKHLDSCIQEHLSNISKGSKNVKRVPFFHVQVVASYMPEYWLHVRVDREACFKDIDKFLRETWLECCGHMSAFSVKGGELGMKQKLKGVLAQGMEFSHEYDFGSTTELTLKVLGDCQGIQKKRSPVQLLARNEPPKIICSICEKAQAVLVCTNCLWDGNGWLCSACAERHECGEDMLLPVVNSPRTGVCGYHG